ncbi:hypothetical protein MAPG_04922 [Magnaporthiopsis poae ATCC 64411]|uniref:Uncharacterized protein n=1 Tax=Magnaporthiopsis poae (strain ATCC 64411 / 73-15) TaxID=644358 RepID=A0A0C4DY13_MAGP6|nr:hypothetical protein MAPG_04922 [Magnaporthiopsis poae ATCC 64411]
MSNMAKQNAFGYIQHAPEAPKMANVRLRRRTGDRRADALQDISLQHLRRIVDCVLNLDLETTLFLTKGTSSDSQRANIRHHFRRRYEGIQPISDWLDKQLSAKTVSGIDVVDAAEADDHDALGELTERQLCSILRETNAANAQSHARGPGRRL